MCTRLCNVYKVVQCVQGCTLCTGLYNVYKIVQCVQSCTLCTRLYNVCRFYNVYKGSLLHCRVWDMRTMEVVQVFSTNSILVGTDYASVVLCGAECIASSLVA